jgi:hypothetical protein
MRIVSTALCLLVFSALPGGTGAVDGRLSTSAAAMSVQDAVYLDRRISMLETRLISIESSLRSLQQQSMSSERLANPQPARDPEVTLLRSELEIMSSRLRELECGLVRLDERTLSPSAREARRRSGTQPGDPCRANPDMPIQFSTRR